VVKVGLVGAPVSVKSAPVLDVVRVVADTVVIGAAVEEGAELASKIEDVAATDDAALLLLLGWTGGGPDPSPEPPTVKSMQAS
jgi:hypothetical protein